MRKRSKTLRLLMPQWQGGDYDLSVGSGELYPLGARLLAFLAPKSETETVEVPIAPYSPGSKRTKENGVVNQDVVIRQMKAARDILEEKQPDRLVTFGGECLVSQAPFDYLNGRYKGNLGVLWIDAHPDISTPKNHDREHAMVLGNLLGRGDPIMAREVKNPIKPEQALLVGMEKFDSPKELETIEALKLPVLPPQAIAENSDAVIKWLQDNKIENLAIHLDVDCLDPKIFYSQLTSDPGASEPYPTVKGQLNFAQIMRLLGDISRHVSIVGLTIAEYMPWDALNLQKLMAGLDIMS